LVHVKVKNVLKFVEVAAFLGVNTGSFLAELGGAAF